MIGQLTSSNVFFEECIVSRVYGSGLIDAISTSGAGRFERIQILSSSGIDSSIEEDDRVVVLSDGSKHYAIGTYRQPKIDSNGLTTIRNRSNDLTDLSGSKSLISEDDFGNQARVTVSRGGGVVVDTGEKCLTHYDPGSNRQNNYYERKRDVSPPHTAEIDHNGATCTSTYKWRTTFDPLSVSRDYEYDEDESLDIGNVVKAEINPTDNVQLKTLLLGQETAKLKIDPVGNIEASSKSGNINISTGIGAEINIDSNGSIEIKNVAGSINIDSSGKVEAKSANGRITMTPGGQFYIGSNVTNLMQTISLLLDSLSQAQTATLIGPSPLLPTQVVANVLKPLHNATKGS